jgi:hypothetical protein
MPKANRIRRVTVTTERTFVFRNQDETRVGWCAQCNALSGMNSAAGTAHELGLSELAVYRLVESGAVHFSEDAGGHLSICLRSFEQLSRLIGKE